MLIDYVSSAMDAQDFSELFKDKSLIPGQQAQKYNRLMIQGFAGNDIEVHAITGRPVTGANYSRKFLHSSKNKKGNITYFYGSVLNIRGLKNIWQMASTFRMVCRDSKKRRNVIVCDVLNASIAYGASLAAKVKHRPCIGIVTDLPELMVTGNNRIHICLVKKVLDNCTAYIPLTDAINDKINVYKKPFVIVEGLCDINMKMAKKSPPNNIRKCIYAGLLDSRYGVKTMVEGFINASLNNTELHIYGNGPYAEELKQIARENPSIVYHGTVMNEEVVAAELDADLLINPRPTKEMFTKYSFPSKNLEYMVSGTAVLTTNLPGMPKEYRPYVYLFEDETVLGIAHAFESVMKKTNEELYKKGLSARSFVLEKKNNFVQANRVIKMIHNLTDL